MQQLPEFLTVIDIAKLLKLNPITVYSYIKAKRLAAVKIGRHYRVAAPDFLSFLETVRVR